MPKIENISNKTQDCELLKQGAIKSLAANFFTTVMIGFFTHAIIGMWELTIPLVVIVSIKSYIDGIPATIAISGVCSESYSDTDL